MAEQKNIHLHCLGFSSFLLPFFSFCLSFKCGRLLRLFLGAVSKGWDDCKIEGERIIWSTRLLEFMSCSSFQVVLLSDLSPNKFQENENNEVGLESVFD